MRRKKLTIVIPAYNEEASLETSILKVKESCPDSKIIIVNDGSIDNTEKVAKKLHVRVITHDINKGYGAALKTGLREIDTDYVAFLDADLTYDPEYLPILLTYAEKEELDCVWGNRFGGSVNRMLLIRKIGNRLIALIFFLTTLKKINDCSSGERLLRNSSLKKLDIDTLPDDLDFITALTKRIVKRGLRYREIPMDYGLREGKSKLNIFKHGYKMIKNILVEK